MRILLKRNARGWQTMLWRGAGEVPAGPKLGEVVARGRSALLAWRQQLHDSGAHAAWCAEFPKSGLGEGELCLGYAELAAAACAQPDVNEWHWDVPPEWHSSRSVRRALRQKGMPVLGSRFVDAWLDISCFSVAAILAWLSLLVDAVRHARTSRALPAQGWLLAVHGEWSNRTRHVLLEAVGARPPAAVLVVGRPHIYLRRLQNVWRSALGTSTLPAMIRPWSLVDVMAAVPQMACIAVEAIRIGVQAPYLPPFRERVAMLYRAYMGMASKRWWQRQSHAPGVVVYGHTGNADTTLLELAQQRDDQRTWHVVHGISSGLNFTGRSSVAVFRCQHDAKWHERLGGYGRCMHLPAPVPVPVAGFSGLLLLTNYAHPMNVEYRLSGTQAEESVLHAVANAAAQLGDGNHVLQWRPHPVMATLAQGAQDVLRKTAHKLGFRELPPQQDWLEAARQARWVVTTASTVAIQLLEAGVVPVVLIPDWIDAGCALANHPLALRGWARLPEVLASLDNAEHRNELFAAAWQAIGPGRLATAKDWME